MQMTWTVLFAEEFEPEFDAFESEVQDAILARALLLEREGLTLGRPHALTNALTVIWQSAKDKRHVANPAKQA